MMDYFVSNMLLMLIKKKINFFEHLKFTLKKKIYLIKHKCLDLAKLF